MTYAALVLAAGGCSATSTEAPGTQHNAGPADPVEAAIANLGTAVTGCSGSTSATTLTLTMAAGDAVVISAPNGKLTVNGNACTSTVMSVTAPMTTTTTSKIVVNGTSGNNDDVVILDNLPGSFGAKILSASGGITVDFSGGGGNDSFMVRGSNSAETYKFATATTAGSEIYADLTNDKTADVKVVPSTGTTAVTASMGAGNDVVYAATASNEMTGFQGANNIMVGPLTTGLVAYGGAGNDTFTGGSGNDTFYGGTEDDTFKMAATSDGADIYQGDQGNDTVDYSNRTGDLAVDIGPSTATVFGTVDLSTLTYGTTANSLDTKELDIKPDAAASDVAVVFSNPTGPDDIAKQINTACAAAANACSAWITGSTPHLAVATASATTVMNEGITIDVAAMNSADVILGMSTVQVTTVTDADDGLAGEHDDVRATTENILGGSGNDTLVGDSGANTIKGGSGDDHIEGGATSGCSSTVYDNLQGEAGNDTISVPAFNCYALIAGNAGTDVADFSGRGLGVNLSNDAAANDGDIATAEHVNIAADVETLTGGHGNDNLTGGASNDTLNGGEGDDFLVGNAGDDTFNGGPGDDTFNGGAGFDTVDYSSYGATAGVTVTLCTAATTATTVALIDTACGNTGNDGDSSTEADQIANVEHVIGGAGDDNMTAAAGVDTTFEGGAGADTLTGNTGNDTLWGDAGNDTLDGAAGDDMLDGGAGDDTLIGGSGDGDVCVPDSMDVTTPATGCELT